MATAKTASTTSKPKKKSTTAKTKQASAKKTHTAETKTKAKTTHAKPAHAATKTKAEKTKTKSKTKSKKHLHPNMPPKSDKEFSLKEKSELLLLIEEFVELHRNGKSGLRSLSKVHEILDYYNQRYADIDAKFDAIVEYGMHKNPAYIPEAIYVPVVTRESGADDLYAVLQRIWEGKVKFDEAKEEIRDIYHTTLKLK